MHPETTIRLANMRRDDLLRAGQRFTLRNRSTRNANVEGARS